MAKKFFKRYLPDGVAIAENRIVRRFGPWLSHPSLWHLNRRSAAGGVAIGLAAGLIPGPLQVISAVILAMVFRANLPVAIVTTFYTNPFTIVPLYLLAYTLGGLVTGESVQQVHVPDFHGTLSRLGETAREFIAWLVSLGDTLAIGLVMEGTLFATLGYLAVRALWRWNVVREWRNRQRRRAADPHDA